jgi:hypothetical protein
MTEKTYIRFIGLKSFSHLHVKQKDGLPRSRWSLAMTEKMAVRNDGGIVCFYKSDCMKNAKY